MKKTGKKWVPLMLMALCLMTACTSKNGGANPGGAEGNIVTVSQGYETSAVSIVLSKIDGTVDLEDKSGNTLEKREGMFLYNGNRVATSERSYAYLELDDVKAAKMGQFSSMEVRKETKELSLYLEAGEMFFNVEKHLENDEAMNIRTSTMITGIRGTAGFVRVIDFLTTEIYLLDGEVEVTVIDPVTGATKTAVIKAGQKATTAVFKNKRNTDDNVAIMIDSFTEDDVPAYVIEEIAKNGNLQERILLGRTLNTSIMIRDRAKALVRDTETGKMLAMQEEEAAEAWAKGNKLDEMFSDGTEPIEVVETESTLTDPTLAQVQEALDDERYETVNVEGTFTFGDGDGGLQMLASATAKRGEYILSSLSSKKDQTKRQILSNAEKVEGGENLRVPAGKKLNLNGKTAFGSNGSIQNYGIVTNNGSLYVGGALDNLDNGQFVNNGSVVFPQVADGGEEEHEHVRVTDPEVKATCTEDGLTKGAHCAICQEILEPQRVIPATGHKETKMTAVAATCEKTGLTEGKKCSVCGEILVEQESIPAKGHQMKRVTTQEATCTEDGHTDGEVCSVCGKKTYTVIPAFGHDTETVQGYAATCTENGLTDGIECMRCGEWIQSQQTIQKTGHHWETYNGNDVAAGNHAATCTEPGLENQYCTNCGDRRSVTSDALGHVKVVDVEAKDAKCFENGCTEGWHCSRAGCNYRVESQTINMIGSHSYVARDGKEPTCTEGGWWPYDECTVCGDVFNAIPRDPLGHQFEDAATGEQLPTCERCGAVNPNY